MATGIQERVSQNLTKQLSVAVRSVQWSYGIFWSPPKNQNGELVWGDGYYNGDIKTRKRVPAAKVYTDTLGFCRSDQLRELYESIQKKSKPSSTKGKESKPQSSRLADVLSDQDELSVLEKYYLKCMDFSLPGKAYDAMNEKPVWHYIARDADSIGSTRSLAAKEASVKTVICFPYEGGVLELGVTDLVEKDHDLIFQHIKTSLEDLPKPKLDVKVTITENKVLIKMKCSDRQHLQADILKAVGILCLKTKCNSSTDDGILTMTLEAEFQGSEFASAKVIENALPKILLGFCEERRTMPINHGEHV